MKKYSAKIAESEQALVDLYRALSDLRDDSIAGRESTFAVLAEGPIREIHRIRAEIDALTGITAAEHEAAPLWLRLVGQKARWAETPASVVTAFLDAFRKGVQSIAAFNTFGSVGGRPPNVIKEACDIELVAFAPGSFQVGMRFPEPDQLQLFPTGYWDSADHALKEFLTAARWASSQASLEELATVFSDTKKRRVIVRSLKPFVPRRNGGIEFLELSGSAVSREKPLKLTCTALDRLTEAADAALSPEEEQYEGEIREMDLDRRTFKLREIPDVGEVSCKFEEEVPPVARGYLGSRVRVVGVRTSTNRRSVLKFVDMERLE